METGHVRVLLTGAEGYLGAVMVPVLVSRGHHVTSFDTGFYREGLLYGCASTALPTITCDIRKITIDDLRGFEAVIHLAELSNDPLGQHRPDITYAINGSGSARVARCAREAGVRRFIYSSSCSVYGVGNEGEWKSETSAVAPLTAYADCKLRTEAVLEALADDWFSPTVMRNATAYGASPRMRFDIVLNQFAGMAATQGRIGMNSDGSPWRPLIHVLDIAEAFACVLEAPLEAVHNQVLNVGADEENYRVREIAELVAAAFPSCETTFGPPDNDGRSYRVSFEKLRKTLPGFRCRWSAEAGARQLANLFTEIGLSEERFRFRAFNRLAQLRHLLATSELDDQFFWTVGTTP
jgi:nucleoside-diphosphate-sugar epimerase